MALLPLLTPSGIESPDGLQYDVTTALQAIAAGVFYPSSVKGTDNAAGLLLYSPNVASACFFANTGNDKRSYLLRIQAYRAATLPMGDGVHGVDDAAVYAIYRSYAADTAVCQQRGLNAQVNHRGASGGSIGNLIGTNASTSTTLAGDCVALTLVNEDYAPATGGVSGALDLLHLHEGPNAVGGEFGLRIRNQKKNGSQTGSGILVQNDDGGTAHASRTFWKYGLDLGGLAATAHDVTHSLAAAQGVSTAKGDIRLGTDDANGLPAIISSGKATNDGEIVTQVGADTLWADGSLYIGVLDGAGTIWQKKNDTWTALT